MKSLGEDIIRVLIADDHPLVRKGLRALLVEFDDIELVGEAVDGREAVALFSKFKPDIILMDLVMPKMDGIEATRVITGEHPDARILVLTSFINDEYLFPAIKAGALGYLLKEADPKELIQSIHQIYLGRPSLDPSIARKVLMELGSPRAEKPAMDELTEREIEVLTLLAEGLENNQIAKRLSVADVTVRTHISHILDKLHLSNRVQATLYALREGYVTLDVEQEV
ncbi:MAG: DNA-binding response regulator [Chloroflexota bacterium]|nr:MAG: DNA-binding response regulator [Chloroflexota bacterium]